MNSINQNQPEDNHEDLTGEKAIEKIRDLAEDKICFFCTTPDGCESNGARPMSVRRVDDWGDLWFLTACDSHMLRDIERDSSVTLYIQGSPHSDFLQLKGIATISQDKSRIEALWSPMIKTWFTEGMDDPRIRVIQVKPTDGYYWDTKHGHAVAFAKIAIGAMIGKTLDDSIEGKIEMH